MEGEKKNPDRLDKFTWLIYIVVIILVGVFALKMYQSDFSFDFSDFSFSDLLALILALFSIALAATFYFKATETSNTFHDNTYKFTQHISETLGRMDERFGERLSSLGEGTTRLENRFDSIRSNLAQTTEDIEVKEDETAKKEEEYKNTINELLEKAKLGEHEQKEYRDRLSSLENELINSREESQELNQQLMRQQNRLRHLSQETPQPRRVRPSTDRVRSTIRELLKDPIKQMALNL